MPAASGTPPARTGRRRSCSSPIGCSPNRTWSRAGSRSGCWSARCPIETERTWQLLRRAAREAGDWITVDDLAHPYGKGIAAEPYRWAELEQLVFSPSRWERRLVGSTIATMTHGHRRRGLDPEVVRRALPLLGQLMGDAEPDVQKALSWAYRSLAQVDLDATTEALRAETERAAATDDGHRAWVIRDTFAKLDPADARRAPRASRRHPQAPGRPDHLARRRDLGSLRRAARSRQPSRATARMTRPSRSSAP